jgi:fructokinase
VTRTDSIGRAGLEAGGTKFICAIGTGPDDVQARTVIPTTTPEETLTRVAEFFADRRREGLEFDALGVASFGPLDLAPDSPTYGYITTTPKPGWTSTDLLGPLRRRLEVPIALETDVNGAAYGEFRWGAGRELHSSAYLTVGTGIGGGAVIRGEPLHGLGHPEMGHLHVERHPSDDFVGSCPFHGDCLEGLASGPAIQARSGRPPEDLGPDRQAAIDLEAWYLGQLVSTVIYMLSPQLIVLGGGVLQLDGLMNAVRASVLDRLGGALDGIDLVGRMDQCSAPWPSPNWPSKTRDQGGSGPSGEPDPPRSGRWSYGVQRMVGLTWPVQSKVAMLSQPLPLLLILAGSQPLPAAAPYQVGSQ